VEKLRSIHRNPVKRGLVVRPEDWTWSNFRHYLNGQAGPVEIESQWTARRREHAGIFPIVVVRPLQKTPAQAQLGRGTRELERAIGRATRPRSRAKAYPIAALSRRVFCGPCHSSEHNCLKQKRPASRLGANDERPTTKLPTSFPLVLLHHAVFDVDHAMGVFGNVVFVGDQDDGVAFGLQAIE